MSEDFTNRSVPRHLLRGAVGFGALAGAIAGAFVVGWVSLVLVPVGLVALRGCPMCWTIGLVQTVSAGRLRRSCRDGRCELTVASASKPDRGGRSRPAALLRQSRWPKTSASSDPVYYDDQTRRALAALDSTVDGN